MATVDRAQFSYRDYDGEPSNTSVNIVELDGTNFDAQVALINTLRTSMNGLTLVISEKVQIADTVFAATVPVLDNLAQREIKWAVIVADVNNNRYKAMEIPIADLSILENNSKYIVKGGSVAIADVTNAAKVQAFIDAFEAVALDRFGQTLQVWDVYQVGRNT